MAEDNAGTAGNLFTLNLKINGVAHGFNEKFHFNGANYAAVLPGATAVVLARKRVMPADCEIAYATISKDNPKRDRKYIPGGLGAGLFINSGVSPAPTACNDDKTCLNIRLENEAGGEQTYKLGLIPDGVVTSNDIVGTVVDVTATWAGADTAPTDLFDFPAQMTYLLKMITKYCIALRSGHSPGGPFVYNAFTAAYYMKVGKKKGGKRFAR